MGITGQPGFSIVANSEDITNKIKNRLVSLRVVDDTGLESDSAEIVLSDTWDVKLDIPKKGAKLEISLGYDSQLKKVGSYVVDEVRLYGPPDAISITARSAFFESAKTGEETIKSVKRRTWAKGTTILNLVKTIASEHGLTPAVADTIGSKQLPYLFQNNETDLSLLTLIARKYGAVLKIADGKIILTNLLESKTAISKVDTPTIKIEASESASYSMTIRNRPQYASVIAAYYSTKAAARTEVKVGSGEPALRLKTVFKSQAEAYNAAKTKFIEGTVDSSDVQLNLIGRVDLFAEITANLTGFRPGISGVWKIKRVEHSLDSGGFKTSVALSKNITEIDLT